MRNAMTLARLLFTVFCSYTHAGSRKDELVYLRIVMPDTLLKHAHLDIVSLKSVAIY